MLTFKQFILEDSPDTPTYSTPANFNNDKAPTSTHAKNSPDVPTNEDLGHADDEVLINPDNKTADKTFRK